MPRTIDPSLRGRQRELTRRLLIDAFTRVILRDGIHEFSMQAVADEAGCAVRTLYRYFPNRESLIAGLNTEMEELVESSFMRAGADESADLADAMVRITLMCAERSDLVRAWSTVDLVTEYRSTVSARAHKLIDSAIDRVAPSLAPDEHARVHAALRLIVRLRSWLSLTDELSADDAALASGWMIRTLLDDLANGGGPKSV